MPGPGGMSARAFARLADDPRAVTLTLVALVAAALWLALGHVMAPGGSAAVALAMCFAQVDWSAGLVGSTIAMWLLMMAAMMLPAMAPMLAVYSDVAAREDRGAALALRVGLFALGYLVLWALFSTAAAGAQLALRDSAHFTLGGTLATPAAAGVLLMVAGAYQFSRLKDHCLTKCRHPLTFLMAHWREGRRGAFPLGLRHGVYCLGCCVALMGLMFVFGAMNVLWMAAIALYCLAEKVLPRERLWGRVAGGAMLATGAAMLASEVI